MSVQISDCPSCWSSQLSTCSFRYVYSLSYHFRSRYIHLPLITIVSGGLRHWLHIPTSLAPVHGYTYPILILHSSYTHPTLIVCSSHTHPMLILHSSYTHPTLILYSSYTHLILILCSSYTHPMLILCSAYAHPRWTLGG